MDQTGAEEMLQCFDEQGNPTESLPRSIAKANDHTRIYGIANIWLVNDAGQIMCSKRSESMLGNPGKWQTYFGGHVTAGLSFAQTVIKELAEEAGLDVIEDDLRLITEGKFDEDPRIFKSYAIRFNGAPSDLHFADGEITDAKWMDMDEYWKDKEANLNNWCNSCKPEHQEKIREWLKT
jgi:isopentenyldiphosphate isomerase